MSPRLKKELDEHYKTAYALSFADTAPMEIARYLTFDSLVPKVVVGDLMAVLNNLNTVFLGGKIKGVGLEVGSGPGTFVAAFANIPAVTKVYGVEACEAIVQELMVDVTAHIAGENTHKVIGAIGDFDHLELPDDSVDFAFDFFSLHHSPDLLKTLNELYRVMKPGGVLICLDKARSDNLRDSELEALLDMKYSTEAKVAMGINPNISHTRRMNGEYEYRLRDWKKYFAEAQFSKVEHYNLAKQGGMFPVRVIKSLIAMLPPKVQTRLSGFSKKVTNNLEPSNRIFSNIFPLYPREFSLLIVHK